MPTPRDVVKPVSHLELVESPEYDNTTVIANYITHRTTTGRRWRPETVRVRTSQMHLIAEELHPTRLVDVTEEEVLAWSTRLRGRPETIASYISAIHGLYRWMSVLARPRLRADDPTLILERPRIPTAMPRPMLDRHYDLALACAVSRPELYLWLGLMGCCGLRCCEVAWLHTGDVEQLGDGGGLLHVTGKGGKQRVVPAGQMLMLTMRPFLHGRGPVFTRELDGGPHSPHGVSARVNEFLRGIGVPATAHQLRHRFGTDFHQLDPDLYRQAKIMGHASVDTTQRYTEISPVEAARHIEALTNRRLRPARRSAA